MFASQGLRQPTVGSSMQRGAGAVSRAAERHGCRRLTPPRSWPKPRGRSSPAGRSMRQACGPAPAFL